MAAEMERLTSAPKYLPREKPKNKAEFEPRHLIRGSIAAWDCSHFRETCRSKTMICFKGYTVCEGRLCKDFEESL